MLAVRLFYHYDCMRGRMEAWMNTLAVTIADLVRAVRAARGPWEEIIVDDEVVGSLARTSRDNPAMCWYWQGMGSEGHAATRLQAIEAIEAHALEWLPRNRRDRAAQAAARA